MSIKCVSFLRMLVLLLCALILVAALPAQGSRADARYTVMFHDGFDGGDTSQWEHTPDWYTVEEDGNWYLRAETNGFAFLRASLGQGDYRFRVDLRLYTHPAGLHFRRSGDDYYAVDVAAGGSLYLEKPGFPPLEGGITRADAPITQGEWHTVEISCTAAHIQVLMDDVLYLDYEDPDPIYYGTVELVVYDAPSSPVEFDNVEVLVPSSVPPPWEQTNGPTGAPMSSIVIHPTDSTVLYSGGPEGSIYKTTDAGESWFPVPIPVRRADGHIHTLIVDPGSPDTLYAVESSGIWKTTDGGETWRERLDGIDPCHQNIGGLVMDPSDPDTLYAATNAAWSCEVTGAVYKTTDGGDSWTNISSSLSIPPGARISEMDANNSEIYVSVTDKAAWQGGKLFHSTDDGATWDESEFLQPADTSVSRIYMNPDDPEEVWIGLFNIYNIGMEGLGLFVTYDGGTTWQPVHSFHPGGGVNLLTKSPSGALYANGYRTSDGGSTWENYCDLSESDAYGELGPLAFDPNDEDTLYMALTFGTGLIKTTDGGRTWYQINDGMLNTSISMVVAHPNEPGTLYSGSIHGQGVSKTTDYGYSWTRISGRGQGFVDDLEISPHDADTVWEAVDVGDVFGTTDGGQSWRTIIGTQGDGFRAGSVYAMAAAPSDADVIYALKNGYGIFKVDSRRESMQFLHQSEIDYTYSIAVHPTNPDIVYSGYSPKPFQKWAMVRQSTDGGTSWRTALHVPDSTGITSVAIDPNDPDTVYAGSTGERGEVYKSANGGDSWSKLNEHFTMCTVWGQPQLIIHPDNPLVVYAATWLGGTWKTEDAGENWMLLEEAPISSTALSLDPQNSDVIYLADRSTPTVWKSTDAGSTWEKVADFSSDGALLVMRVLAANGTVYASTFHPSLRGGRLYKSTDSGATWTNTTGALPKGILDLAVDPTNSDIVYVTTNINGAHKSVDGGASWTQMYSFPDVGAYDIEVDPVDPATLYTSARGGSLPAWFTEIAGDRPDGIIFTDPAGVYRSTDSGSTWTQVLTTTASCRAIRLHPDNRNVLLAVDLVDGLLVSIDGGGSWISQNTGLDTDVLTSCAVGGDKIYVGTQGCGVYSGDFEMSGGSVSWQPDRSNKPVPEVHTLQIKIDPTDSNRIFVSSYPGGLYRSDDGGATFRDKNGITPSVVVDDPVRQGYYTYAINPNDTSEMWLGTWGKGIFKSYNAMNLDIPANGSDRKMYGKHINQILISPDSPDTVYVATEEGVFTSSDGGDTWSDLSAGLHTTQIRTLEMTADRTLLCGTLGCELYYYDTSNRRWEQMPGFGQFGTHWPIWDDRPLYPYSSILFHPTDPNVVYIGTFPGGIYKSTDAGQTWRESNVGWTNDGVFCLVTHPDDPEIIYAGTYNGMNVSWDAGAHWEMWDEGWPDEQWVFAIDFDPRDPDVMYACSKDGSNEGQGREGFHGTVMKSLDGGAHWLPITQSLSTDCEFYKILVDDHNPDTLYLLAGGGIYISHDGGERWTPWNEGLTDTRAGLGNNVTDTFTLTCDGRYLFFGTFGSGVFRRLTVGLENLVTLPMVLKEWQ